jgi:hypothetical protein
MNEASNGLRIVNKITIKSEKGLHLNYHHCNMLINSHIWLDIEMESLL